MDDLFDQVKKELEENGGTAAAAEAEKAAPEQSAQDLIDDISWDDVAGELEEQRDMIKDEAAGKSAASGGGTASIDTGLDDGLLSSLSGEQRQQLPPNIGFILDIPLHLSVEIGRARMIINDLLQLGQGSVIELEKLAGEPFDVLVNNKLIARGDFEKALTDLELILKTKPDDKQALAKKAELYRKIKAAKYLDKALRLFDQADYRKAAVMVDSVMLLNPQSIGGQSLKRQLMRYTAKPTTLEDIKKDSKHWQTYLKGTEAYQTGNYKKALRLWRSLLQYYPNNQNLQRNIDQAAERAHGN